MKIEKYVGEIIKNIKNIIKNDNILILKDFDFSLYDEKQVMKYDIYLEEKDKKIIDYISKYLNLLLSFNNNKKLKIKH